MAVLEAEYRWIEGSGAAFGAPGLAAALDVGGQRYGGHGIFGVQPGLVHGLARHSERGVFSDHRPAPDPRYGVPDLGRRDVFPGRKADA